MPQYYHPYIESRKLYNMLQFMIVDSRNSKNVPEKRDVTDIFVSSLLKSKKKSLPSTVDQQSQLLINIKDQ